MKNSLFISFKTYLLEAFKSFSFTLKEPNKYIFLFFIVHIIKISLLMTLKLKNMTIT